MDSRFPRGDCRSPVAATVLGGLRCARPDHVFEAIGQPYLNAQSPSERSDGDCALS
jgi:hypothetical protein